NQEIKKQNIYSSLPAKNPVFAGNFGENNNPVLDNNLKSDIVEIKNQQKTFAQAVDTLDEKISKTVASSALGSFAPTRRLQSAVSDIEKGDIARGVGIMTLAAANLPQDIEDVRVAVNCTKGNPFSYDYKAYQHPFSFFRGTLFEKALKPLVNKNPALLSKINNFDKSIFETQFGEKIQEKLNIDIKELNFDKKFVDNFGKEIPIFKLKGTKFGKLIGDAMLRTPKLSVYALALLELPAIIKSFSSDDDKIENGTKQTVKSTVKVGSITAGMGLVGAKLAKKSPILGLIGMGLGATIGGFASNEFSNFIDKV
ncbi:MAG: hypothetical protein PHV68_09265, partial [Candidatus Gastranaerophilales bacterium]|nr:hypothetical protein [Candidatus Gastranaerophilales bacterium]